MKTARQFTQRAETRRTRRSGIATVALALVVVAALTGSAAAHRNHSDANWGRDSHATGSLVDVQVLVGGDRVPLFYSSSYADRRYFEASRGRNYALEVRNRTGQRIAVLIAVDGLNVVNGERSSLGRLEPMYVLDPWESATIRGWRTSLEQVQQFVFVDEERSYASRTDQANGDMGWIRILAFEEERPVAFYAPPRPWFGGYWGERAGGDREHEARQRPAAPSSGGDERQSAASPETGTPPVADRATPPQASAKGIGSEVRREAQALDAAEGRADAKRKAAEEASPGTGWGARRHDPVREVRFEPAVAAGDHIVLRYEYASGLAALGIFPNDDRLWERERGELSFARPPRW
jgi:hypothetical protein